MVRLLKINNDLTADLMCANAEIETLKRKIKLLEAEVSQAESRIEWYRNAVQKFQEIGLTPAEIIEMQARIEGLEK